MRDHLLHLIDIMDERDRNELDKRYLFLRRTAYLLLYATAFSWLILLAMSGKI